MAGARRILLVAAMVVLARHGDVWAQSRVEWTDTWAEAQALATRHHRLILIHFWNPDCAPCLKLERTVFNQPEFVRAVAINYIPLKVNAATEPDMAHHFGVDRWPTDVIVSASGQEIYRSASPLDTHRYVALLDQVAAHARVGMPVTGAISPSVPPTPNPYGGGRDSAFPASTAFPATPAGSPSFPLAAEAPPTTSSWNPGYSLPGSEARPSTPGTAQFPMPSPVQAPAANAMAGTANPWVTPDASAPRMPIAEQRASFNASPGGDFPLPSAPAPSYANHPHSGPFQAPAAPSQGPAFAPSAAVLGPPTSGVALSPPALPAARPGIASSPPSLPAAPPALAAAPPAPPTTPPASPAAQRQTVALDGYCPVTLVEREKWVKGDPKWGALHRGRTYLFAGPDEQRRFLENQAFEKYAPALSGYDAVKYAEQGTMVDGRRSHGVFYRGQVFLFADEAALQQFWTAPDRYAGVVRAEQQQSAMRSSLQR